MAASPNSKLKNLQKTGEVGLMTALATLASAVTYKFAGSILPGGMEAQLVVLYSAIFAGVYNLLRHTNIFNKVKA